MFIELADTTHEFIKECINGQIGLGPTNNAGTVINCKLISHLPQLTIRSVLNIVLLFILLVIDICLKFSCGELCIVDSVWDSRSKKSGVQFPLLVIYAEVSG